MNDLKKCEQNDALATKSDTVSEALYSQQGGRADGRGGRGGRGDPPRWCITTTNGYEEVIKKAETAMNAEKQDISREIVQSNKIGAEMEMEEEMEMEVDSTATVLKPVPEMETVDSTATAMELVLETAVDSTAKAIELVLEMEAWRKWILRPRQ
jgi:hypothetical protein